MYDNAGRNILGNLQMKNLSLVAIATMLGSPALAIDPCLLGNWEPDYLTFGEQYMDAMNAQSVSITGDMVMSISDADIGTYLVENLNLDVVIADTPPMSVLLNGNGEFSMTTEDETFVVAMGPFSYDAQATINMGAGDPMVMEIPVTDEMAPFGGAAGLYTCSAATLEFEPLRGDDGIVGNMITKWYRTD